MPDHSIWHYLGVHQIGSGPHAGPRLEALDACLGKTEQAFRITKALFTGEAPRVLLRHGVSRQIAVLKLVPDAPSPMLVTRPRLHQKDVARGAFAVPNAPPVTPSLILRPLQRVEPAPPVATSDVVARLGADHVRNAEFIE